ncbi:MAG: MvaI/BcnI restriction endonuclease family protein, partial [Oxalobacteraceae bacterium]
KHPQTFWVGAKVRGKHEAEEFHYVQIQHTRKPKVRNFDALLEGGQISVDYLMSQKTPGRSTVRDHGYLFKINPRDFDALFPPAEVHVFS